MKNSIKLWAITSLSIFLLSPLQGASDQTLGIVGGVVSSGFYSALTSSSTNPELVTGLPSSHGKITAVAINGSGQAAIAGSYNTHTPFASLVSKDGAATPITFPTTTYQNGEIHSIAIHESGSGVFGGYMEVSNAPPSYQFACKFDTTSGNATQLTGGTGAPIHKGKIESVAINWQNTAIIGGSKAAANGTTLLFASIVSNGISTSITGLPNTTSGMASSILSVAINGSGYGIIGGYDVDNAYAALVSNSTSTPTTTPLTGSKFSGNVQAGQISSVAINENGNALIGGKFHDIYAATVNLQGVATELQQGSGYPASEGNINSVGLNSSEAGVIGGYTGGSQGPHSKYPYVALVLPNGEAKPLNSGSSFPSGSGQIHSVAISESGVSLIGGEIAGAAYLALLSPSGDLTSLGNFTNSPGSIQAVALQDESDHPHHHNDPNHHHHNDPNHHHNDPSHHHHNHPSHHHHHHHSGSFIDPTSFGPGNSFADPILSLSTTVLRNRLNHLSQSEGVQQGTLSYVLSSTDKIYRRSSGSRPNYSLWLSPFGFYTEHKTDAFPSYQDRAIGAMLGFDCSSSEGRTLGGGVAFSYQDIDDSKHHGNATSHQELATLYGKWETSLLTVDGALWGGLYQLQNCRTTLGFIPSESSIHGGLLAPHIGVSKPFAFSSFQVAPYLSVDWVNNWQGEVREFGISGLNLRIAPHFVSLIRSEAGMLFAQRIECKSGLIQLQEGLSFVNKKPLNARRVSTYYVGSISTFDLQLFDDKIQNLGSLQLSTSFTPKCSQIPALNLSYQGEWGKGQSSNRLTAEITQRF